MVLKQALYSLNRLPSPCFPEKSECSGAVVGSQIKLHEQFLFVSFCFFFKSICREYLGPERKLPTSKLRTFLKPTANAAVWKAGGLLYVILRAACSN